MAMPQNNAYTQFMQEEGEKVLRKFLKEKATEAVTQPGGAEQMAEMVGKPEETQVTQTQPKQKSTQQPTEQTQGMGILQQLMQGLQSGEVSQEQVFGAINELAQTPVEIPGSAKGIIDAIKGGGGFGKPRTQAMGINDATTMIKKLVETSKLVSEETRALQKHIPEMIKLNYEAPKTQAEAGLSQLKYVEELAKRMPEGEGQQFMQEYVSSISQYQQMLQQIGGSVETTNTPMQKQADRRVAQNMQEVEKFERGSVADRDLITGELTPEGKARQSQLNQQALDSLKAAQNSRNAQLRISGTFDDYLNMVDETHRKAKDMGINLPPGLASGVVTSVMGKAQVHEFYEGFKGGLIEYAAAAGANAIPGARAVRLVALFENTAPNIFSSLPAAINNSAVSFRNAIFADMRANPTDYMPDYTGSLQDNRKLAEMGRKFYDDYKEGMFLQAYIKNEELVPANYRVKIEQKLKQIHRKDLEKIAGR
jgi:hypothetical protein